MNDYIGEIRLFAFNRAPLNWMLCNGAELQISEYDALFALIGTTYGGDAVSTFALPDFRGRVAVSQGTSASGSNYVIGQVLGSETASLGINTMPSHSHNILATSNSANTVSPSGNIVASVAADDSMYVQSSQDIALHAATISSVGAGLAHENRSPILALSYCICVSGIFPSRN